MMLVTYANQQQHKNNDKDIPELSNETVIQ